MEELEPVLSALGFLDLAPLADATELQAAALGVREAGAVACPWPLVAQLSVPPELADRHGAIVLTERRPDRLEHADLLRSPLVVTTDAQGWIPQPTSGVRSAPLDPFGVPCSVMRADVDVDLRRLA